MKAFATALILVLAAAVSLPASASVAGKWTVTVDSPQGVIPATLVLEQNGKKLSGTFSSDHTGDAPLEGEFADGKLTFSVTVHTDSTPMSVVFKGELSEKGTLSGNVTSPMGDMTWKAERAK